MTVKNAIEIQNQLMGVCSNDPQFLACEMAIDALKKQIPVKAIPCNPNSTWTKCPICGATDIDEYCGKCGQRLDWENENKKYYEAKTLKSRFENALTDFIHKSEIARIIDDTPTADVEEVVRCKDCICATYIHKKDGSIVPFRCEKFSLFNIADMTYCSWGIRKQAKMDGKENNK